MIMTVSHAAMQAMNSYYSMESSKWNRWGVIEMEAFIKCVSAVYIINSRLLLIPKELSFLEDVEKKYLIGFVSLVN